MSETEKECLCATLPDLAAVAMGGDGLDERVFETLNVVTKHGGDIWWLYLSKCQACGQHWMVAQEERIFDDYFMRRVVEEQIRHIVEGGRWPAEFITYENVLRTGRELSQPCLYVDSMSPALVTSAHDLRKVRADITVEEVAYLLGVTPTDAGRLLAK